jgi:hypothetical protein
MKDTREEPQTWEKEFDAVLETVGSPQQYYEKVKSFITTLLEDARAAERAALREEAERYNAQGYGLSDFLNMLRSHLLDDSPTEKEKRPRNLRDNSDGTCNCRPLGGGCFFTNGFGGACNCPCHALTALEVTEKKV